MKRELQFEWGLTGREAVEMETLQNTLHEWGYSRGLMSRHAWLHSSFWGRLFQGGPNPLHIPASVAREVPWDALIDYWEGDGRGYIFYFISQSLIGVIGIIGFFSVATEDLLSKELGELEMMLAEFNRKQNLIKSGTKSIPRIEALSPVEFESFVAEQLRKDGYSVKLTSASGDMGIDIIAIGSSEKIVVQCKKWRKAVGQPVVRDFYGALMHEKADRGLLVTTSRFSKQAIEFAGGKPIELIDSDGLLEWVGRLS